MLPTEQAHGIELVLVANGATMYVTRSFDESVMPQADDVFLTSVGLFV
jgi:hypothetical protein